MQAKRALSGVRRIQAGPHGRGTKRTQRRGSSGVRETASSGESWPSACRAPPGAHPVPAGRTGGTCARALRMIVMGVSPISLREGGAPQGVVLNRYRPTAQGAQRRRAGGLSNGGQGLGRSAAAKGWEVRAGGLQAACMRAMTQGRAAWPAHTESRRGSRLLLRDLGIVLHKRAYCTTRAYCTKRVYCTKEVG